MRKELLTVDGIVNLLLGVFLMWYPASLVDSLGLPSEGRPFFASILGGVLFGVGVALLIERWRPPLQIVGLGLGGAIAINLCGGVVLAAWLLTGLSNLTALGHVALWALVVLLVGLSALELVIHPRRARDQRPSN
jgi:hypothetical protein